MLNTSLSFTALTPQGVWYLIAVILLLLLSATISATGKAYDLLSQRDEDSFESINSSSKRAMIRLIDESHYRDATIIVINTIVDIAIVVVGNALINSWLVLDISVVGEILIKFAIFGVALILFGDILARTVASYATEKFARSVALPLLWFISVFKPFTFVFVRSARHVNDSNLRKRVEISIDELSNVIDMTSDNSAEDKKILSGIVEFVNTEVSEIMKPRVDIIALDADDEFGRVKEVIVSSGYSRIPVFVETLDHITGVIYVKDLLPFVELSEFDWKTLVRKPYFVPQHKKINDLLEEFRVNQVHIAMVIDEYGSTMGLVSLEDILEEIVGEISDESDKEQQFYKRVSTNVYIFDGKSHLSDFLRVLELPDDYFDSHRGEAETVAGLMLEIRKDFFAVGDTVHCLEFTLSAEEVTTRRIDKVRVVYHKGESK